MQDKKQYTEQDMRNALVDGCPALDDAIPPRTFRTVPIAGSLVVYRYNPDAQRLEFSCPRTPWQPSGNDAQWYVQNAEAIANLKAMPYERDGKPCKA